MNRSKACNKVKFYMVRFFVMCLILFNFTFIFAGCGLDTFYFVQAPVQVGNIPVLDNIDVYSKTFQFDTQEGVGSSGFSIVGTDVYYKIYTNKSDWENEKKELIRLSENDTAYAADKLVGGYGYNYQRLIYSGCDDSVLIPFTGTSRNIKIRLTDYSDIDDFKACFKINDVAVGVPPLRFNGKSFNFGRVDKKDVPVVGDADVKGGAVPGDNKWYVCLFAVAKGHDAAYTNYYSNIAYLGSVTIDGNNRDN